MVYRFPPGADWDQVGPFAEKFFARFFLKNKNFWNERFFKKVHILKRTLMFFYFLLKSMLVSRSLQIVFVRSQSLPCVSMIVYPLASYLANNHS